MQSGNLHEGERFTYTNSTLGSSWSHEFTTMTNRQLLGLKFCCILNVQKDMPINLCINTFSAVPKLHFFSEFFSNYNINNS